MVRKEEIVINLQNHVTFDLTTSLQGVGWIALQLSEVGFVTFRTKPSLNEVIKAEAVLIPYDGFTVEEIKKKIDEINTN